MDFERWWDGQLDFIQSEFSPTQLNRICDECRQSWNAAKDLKNTQDNTIINVSVRWYDGYLEEFNCNEVRFGSDLLWLRLSTGKNRHIPLRSVRWFSQTPENHSTY